MLWRVAVQVNEFGGGYFSFAYSALASFRMGMSGSAVFPEREEALVGGLRFGGVTSHRVSATDLKVSQ
jgi:hypothetical protein